MYVTKMVTLLGVSRAAVSMVMTKYANHGMTSTAKRNSGRKPRLSERECHTLKTAVSKNHRTTAANVQVELNIHFEDPVSTKQSNNSFTNPPSTAQLQLLHV